MAELLLRPTAGAGYEAGDIIDAPNNRKIRWWHAQNICHPWRNGVSPNGLRIAGSIVEDWCKHTSTRKYERISQTELRRTDMVTMDSVVLSKVPIPDPNRPGKMLKCNVEEFVRRRYAACAPDGGPKLAMFGSPGSEYWYGHRKDYSNDKLTQIWAAIENKTAFREINHKFWPLSDEELSAFLAISIDDFDDEIANELTASIFDNTNPEEPVLTKKRKHFVDWQGTLALSPAVQNSILNRTVAVDIRSLQTFQRSTVVQSKS